MIFFLDYIKRLVYLLIIYSLSRLYFFLHNLNYFKNTSINEFIEGLRFDLSALVYINIPILILLLFPSNFRLNHSYIKFTNILFYLLNIPFIILNNIDIEYFKYTQKRSTFDLISLIQLGNDAKYIIPQYIQLYWKITIFTLIQIWFLLRIKSKFKENKNTILKNIFLLIVCIVIFVVGARGGFQLKPIKPINSGELSESKNTALILNTPFTFIHSVTDKNLIKYNYFNENLSNTIYSTDHLFNIKKEKKPNIIILIMESYSKEFIGFYNNGIGYTPFLDSLMQTSLVFTNAFANGLKSIEALPAITASIPSLMDNPFITANYAQNNFNSIASLLNKSDYNTSFYHGGLKGTMGFYSFSKKADFSDYRGLENYNNLKDFDQSWGIYDEPFMQYFSDEISNKEEPFFSTFFSLSAHPPYTLPKKYRDKLNTSKKIGIRETISYSDFAMKKFFEKSKKEKWFENTIFIITADHTSPINFDKKYNNKIGRYSIPIIIYSADKSFHGINNNIVQQIDIMPTILEITGYNKPFFAFGKSMFSNKNWAINYLQNEYCLITKKSIIINKIDNFSSFKDWNLSIPLINDSFDVNYLKAIKQSYNYKMINNMLTNEN